MITRTELFATTAELRRGVKDMRAKLEYHSANSPYTETDHTGRSLLLDAVTTLAACELALFQDDQRKRQAQSVAERRAELTKGSDT